MTAQECRKGLGTDKAFFVKSRFAVCSGAVFLQTWLQNKRPVGQTQFVVLSVGTIAAKSREISFQYYFTDMAKVGNVKTGSLLIKTSPKIPQKWPAAAKVTQDGNIPGAKSFDQLVQLKTFKHTVKVASKQGTKPDDTVFAVYEPVISITPPPGYTLNGTGGKLFMLAPRWDKATYVSRDDGAAAFSYLSTLTYSSKTGAPEKAVAEHIKKAYSAPASTKPVSSAKKIPGQSASNPLNRLFRDTDRRKKNRSQAIKACEQYWGKKYSQNNKYQCDEFPFATTYQGAAQSQFEPTAPKNNFSAMPLVTADNRDAGILLGQFMTKNRIIDGRDDGFIVKIK
ncbi:NucA/NucB deoxyribonuclease domain-containing protein [Streptomyces sp. NPDC002738]